MPPDARSAHEEATPPPRSAPAAVAEGLTGPNSLAAQGIVGLRSTDLMLDNITCCGDCRNAAPGTAPFRCQAGYLTTLYSIKALYCPDFTPLETLSEAPQEDERGGQERRRTAGRVPVERRRGSERRRDPNRWKRPD